MNEPSSEFIQYYIEYKKLKRAYTQAKRNALKNLKWSDESIDEYLDMTTKGRWSSTGKEKSPEAQKLFGELVSFNTTHPGFTKEERRLKNILHAKIEKIKENNPGMSQTNLNKAIANTTSNFYKFRGPTQKNKNNKKVVLNELRMLPEPNANVKFPQTFPGGIEYQEAKNRFYKNGGKRKTRKLR